MNKWCNMSYIDILNALNTELHMGLNYVQVDKYRKSFGENIILTPKTKSDFQIFIKETALPWSLFMIVFIILSFYTKQYISLLVSTLVYLFIMGIFIYFTHKEQKSFAVLETLNNSKVEVIREGIRENIRIEELVVGDIVFLKNNTYVPADIRLIEGNNLKVNELAVTGKDYIVEKFSARIEGEDLSIEEMNNILFKSTVIKEGEGMGVVIATGMNTKIGSFMKAQLNKDVNNNTLFKTMKKILNKFSVIGFIIGIISFGIAFVLKVEITKILQIIMCIFWAMLPISLCIIFLLSIMVFLKIQKNRGVEINNLSVLSNMAHMKTFLLDKMGILSKEEMYVNKVFIDHKLLKMSSSSSFEIEKYYKEQSHNEEEKFITIASSNTLERLISTSILCNDAVYSEENNIEKGDIKEIAMLKFGINNFIYKSEVNNKFPRIYEIPIDGEKKIKTSINSIDDKYRAHVVGFLESILDKSTHVLKNGIEVEMTKEDKEIIKEGALDITMDGMEVVALAYRNFNYKPSLDENIESNLVFIGLMGIVNPIKTEAYSFNKRTIELGLNPIIFTEENKISAKSFGKEIKLSKDYNNIYSGIEFKYMAEHEIKKIINSENIFCNLNEEQKVLITKEYKKNSESIGVIARKLTDIPHFSEADVAISFGSKVSNILKKISHIYMENANIDMFFQLIYKSKEILNVYLDLINQGILCCSAIVSSIVLSLTINQEIFLDIKKILYITMVIVGISGMSIFVQYKDGIYLSDDIDSMQQVLEEKPTITFFFLKGIFIGILSYVAYIFGITKYDNAMAEIMYIFSLCMGIVFSPLNVNNSGKTMKGFLSNLIIFLNIVNVIFFITLQGIIQKTPFNLKDFVNKKYLIVIILIFLNYFINIIFRGGHEDLEEEVYMG